MSKRPPSPPEPSRLIDLGMAWFRQYSLPSHAQLQSPPSLGELAGYMNATSLTFLPLEADLSTELDPNTFLKAVWDRISRAEAEFCGRVLVNGRDLGRWYEDQDGLTWVIPCLARPVDGLSEPDLVSLVRRGIRVISLNPSIPVLPQVERLQRLAIEQNIHLALDLSEFEADQVDLFLKGIHLETGKRTPTIRPMIRTITATRLAQLNTASLEQIAHWGGLVGLSMKCSSTLEIREQIDRLCNLTSEHETSSILAISSCFLEPSPALPEFNSAEQLRESLQAWLPLEVVNGVLNDNAARFLTRLLGPVIAPALADPNRPLNTNDMQPAY